MDFFDKSLCIYTNTIYTLHKLFNHNIFSVSAVHIQTQLILNKEPWQLNTQPEITHNKFNSP